MVNNFNVLLKYSLKPKMSSKKAILSLVALFIFAFALVAGGGFLITKLMEDDVDQDQFENIDTVYITPENDVSTALSQYIPGSKIINNVNGIEYKDEEVTTVIDTETGVVTSDVDLMLADEMQISSLVSTVNEELLYSSIPADVQLNYNENLLDLKFLTTNEEDGDNESILQTLVIANTVAIYMLILFGFQLLGSEIFEEKSSHAMEIIITNTKPQVHMLVKIISTMLFLLSIILALVLGIVGGVIALKFMLPDSIGMIIDMVVDVLAGIDIVFNTEFIVFIVLNLISVAASIVIFQIFGATMAAMCSSYEDYQKANGPVVFLLLIPYFISFVQIEIISKVLMYVPVFTSFFAPGLYLNGEISLINFGVCVVIQVVFMVAAYILCAPVYREGLLNYNTSSIKEMVKRAYSK